MQDQNFKNHARMVPGYHYFGFALMMLLLIGSIVNVVTSSHENIYSASLLVLAAVVIIISAFYSRVFALKAQDRAIKAEENFRHYILTGKTFHENIKMRQIIALRFAPDDELPGLTEKAMNENLTEKEIKQEIKNWKADFYRV